MRKGRRVVWIELEVSGSEVREGDIVEIYPHSRPEEVEYLLKHFNEDPNLQVVFLGKEMSLKLVLTEYANISSVLNYYFFSNSHKEALASCALNELHR